MHTNASIHAPIHTHIHTHIYIYVCVCVCACVCVCISVREGVSKIPLPNKYGMCPAFIQFPMMHCYNNRID